jgi:hypothetical protein
MGRWGNNIFESDAALDFFSTITDRLEREIAYWMSPEQVRDDSYWLAQVFAPLELMLMLDEHETVISLRLDKEAAIRRRREVFLKVWDGAWNDADDDIGHVNFRHLHRAEVVQLFDRLEAIVRHWVRLSSGNRDSWSPQPLDFSLPHFSIHRSTNPFGNDFISVERFTTDLMGYLEREIIYWLSPEKRSEVLVFNTEEVWVAVDVLAFLAERYEQTPGITAETVRTWRDTTLLIWRQFLESDKLTWDDNDPAVRSVVAAFDHLEAVALKYPPQDWSFSDR